MRPMIAEDVLSEHKQESYVERAERLSPIHAKDPKPGDYWSEMFVPICVVLERHGKHVIICRTTKDVGNNSWTWNLEKPEMMTVDAFDEWLAYGTIDGYWAWVSPEAHPWAARMWKNEENHPSGRRG